MMCGGMCGELAKSAHRMSGNGSELWPTAQARDYKTGEAHRVDRQQKNLNDAVVYWATLCASDCKAGGGGNRNGVLRTQIQSPGRLLNPEWAEMFMGYRPGWTSPSTCEKDFRTAVEAGPYAHLWPAGQGHMQFDHEPPRTISSEKGRAGRIRMNGNAVVPQWAHVAIAAIVGCAEQKGEATTPWK